MKTINVLYTIQCIAIAIAVLNGVNWFVWFMVWVGGYEDVVSAPCAFITVATVTVGLTAILILTSQ